MLGSLVHLVVGSLAPNCEILNSKPKILNPKSGLLLPPLLTSKALHWVSHRRFDALVANC